MSKIGTRCLQWEIDAELETCGPEFMTAKWLTFKRMAEGMGRLSSGLHSNLLDLHDENNMQLLECLKRCMLALFKNTLDDINADEIVAAVNQVDSIQLKLWCLLNNKLIGDAHNPDVMSKWYSRCESVFIELHDWSIQIIRNKVDDLNTARCMEWINIS